MFPLMYFIKEVFIIEKEKKCMTLRLLAEPDVKVNFEKES